MDKIYEMLKSNDFEINVLGARLLIDMAGNNIIRFVNLKNCCQKELLFIFSGLAFLMIL